MPAIVPGSRLGPYEILSPLGAGGMGEVWRAKDTRLGREVAIKVLPEHLSSDPDVRARFEREARTVSGINHPHICTLFDVGRAPGEAGADDTDFLVMELVEGETLHARLQRGPLPTAETLRLGAQIADALDCAHRAGVIHRDLKPGNVMLTPNGAKLMDFGLARPTGKAGGSGSLSVMATMTQSPAGPAPLTAEGTIVGTFQYMAPEQLEGKEADARSDIWALGVTLYEMATGRPAFSGESAASLIGAIMASEPAPLAANAPASPPALDRIIRGCLAKRPADRIQSAHDLALQLSWLAEGSLSGPVAAAGTPRGGGRILRAASLAVGVIGLASLALALVLRSPPQRPALRLQVPLPPDLQVGQFWSDLALSPDGGSIVMAAAKPSERIQLWLRRLDSDEPTPLPGTDGAGFPSWSPDGRSIVFFRVLDQKLLRVDLSGGSPTLLCAAPWGRGASWGAKNQIVFAPASSGPLFRVPADGGTPEPVTVLDSTRRQVAHRYPCFLPDGEHFLFTALPAGPAGFEVFVGSLGSRKVRKIMDADCAPVYVPPGDLVFVRGGKIIAQRFDAGRLQLRGPRVAIADAPTPSDLTGESVATGSRDGRLLFPAIPLPETRLEWLSRDGASLGVVPVPTGHWTLDRLSPDAASATVIHDGGLWVVSLDRAVSTPLIREVRADFTAAWSPDGTRLALDQDHPEGSSIVVLDARSGAPVDSVQHLDAFFSEAADWAPDGRNLLIAAIRKAPGRTGTTGWDLWRVPLDGDREPAPYLRGPGNERKARISPDGAWVACNEPGTGGGQLFVASYPTPDHRTQIATGHIAMVRWGPGGHELFYHDGDGYLVSVPLRFEGGRCQPGKPRRLFLLPEGSTGLDTRDGQRFLISRTIGAPVGTSLRLMLNFSSLMKR